MGRRDAVQVTLEIVAECRRLLPGLIVSYEPGWERRGNGLSANYVGGIVHHTASLSSLARPFPTQGILRDGRSDLPGPLCNFAGPWCSVEQPRLHVMAAFPANHAGASGGRSMGPLPRTNLFNPVVVGLEIDYAGNAAMSFGQLVVGKTWTRAVANVLAGGNVEFVRAHMETSITGKWDPGFAPGKTYDMAEWRRHAAAVSGPAPKPAPIPEDDMPLNAADKILIRDAVWQAPLDDTITLKPTQAWNMIRDIQARVGQLGVQNAALNATLKELTKTVVALAANSDDIDEDALVSRIEALIDSAVADIDASLDDAAKLVNVKVSVDDASPA